MPALLVLLLLVLEEEAAVALFVSLYTFSISLSSFCITLLSDTPGPARATSFAVRRAEQAVLPYWQHHVPHNFNFQPEHLRAALGYVRQHGTVEELRTAVREAWHKARASRVAGHPPASGHGPGPTSSAPHNAPASHGSAPGGTPHGPAAQGHGTPGQGHGTPHASGAGLVAGNPALAVKAAVVDSATVQITMKNNNLVVQHATQGSETWILYQRQANGLLKELGSILKNERGGYREFLTTVAHLCAKNRIRLR